MNPLVKSFLEKLEQNKLKNRKLEEQFQNLAADRLENIKQLVKDLIGQEWKIIWFHSSYYGGHQEWGEDDEYAVYLFAPDVVVSAPTTNWGHGHNGGNENYEAFREFVGGLKSEEQVVRIEVNEDDFDRLRNLS